MNTPFLLRSWLAARSLARGLPAPVADRGAFRVDTNSADEIKRWVFPAICESLTELASSIEQPGYLIKACATGPDLRAALPDGWHIHPAGYFMMGPGTPCTPQCLPGYAIEVERNVAVTHVRIRADSGELAASGYAAETSDVFIYDRIVTAPEHRRRGLGRVLVQTLGTFKANSAAPELLVATEAGLALYRTLGWNTLSVYSTGSIVAPA